MPVFYFGTIDFRFTHPYASHKKKQWLVIYISVSFFLSKRAILGLHEVSWHSFPVAQMVEHGASNAKIMGSIPRENELIKCKKL